MKVSARVQRAGGWWAVEVPEVPGVFTQVKRLEQVEAMVQDAVATMLDIEASDVEVDVMPELAAAAQRAVTEALERSAAAQEAAAAATSSVRAAVLRLREDERLTARDVAAVLGVSHQRVSQIEKAAATHR